MKNLLSLVLISLCAVSCEKEEIPVPAREPGQVLTHQLSVGADYGQQLFFDLSTETMVSQNLKTVWDLGFETSDSGWHIILNTARGGAVAHTGTSDFGSVTSTSGLDWSYDSHTGNLDSTAFGDHRGLNQVYVVDRGYDPQGGHTGYSKVVVLEVTVQGYSIRYANLDGSGDTTVSVAKTPDVRFVDFSFETASSPGAFPSDPDWDLMFTQYMHLFDGGATPYLVMGVLSNMAGVEVAVTDELEFSTITMDHLQDLSFSSRIDAIGYGWKEYDFDLGTYVVHDEVVYVMKDTEGRFFKLHFLDFYDGSGDKGAPLFEFQEM